MGVGDELRDDGGFGDDVAVVGKAGDEAALLGCVLLDYIQAVLWSAGSCRWGEGCHTGLISRYQGSRGFLMSMMTSS